MPMAGRILLLRSAGAEGEVPQHVDVLVTHSIAPRADGIADAVGFYTPRATLVVSSQTTVRVLAEAGRAELFAAPFAEVRAVGSETAKALEAAGARDVRVAAVPGAAGLLGELPASLAGVRVLWPRGSDADTAPLAELARRGALVAAPVVYEKRPVVPEPGLVSRFLGGEWGAVAVSSLAALDVLLSACAGRPLPSVRWGVIGPESARLFAERGLPEPIVPKKAKIADLIAELERSRP